jgi:hypothetical protein
MINRSKTIVEAIRIRITSPNSLGMIWSRSPQGSGRLISYSLDRIDHEAPRIAHPFRVTDKGDEDQHPRRNHPQEAERVALISGPTVGRVRF